MVIAAHFDKLSGQASRARDPRRTLRLEAQGVTASGDTARVLVHNVSASGLLLESETVLAPSERIDVDLPEAGTVPARVIWTSGTFFGCEFDAPISTAALSAAQLRSDVPHTPVPALSGEVFGVRLQRLRKERGLTMSQLAAQLGVSKPTIWAWEQGKARPVEGRIEALAEALDVPPADIVAAGSASVLPDVIARAKEQIAGVLGVTPDKVRIVVDL